MCDRLPALRKALEEWAGGFDPALVSVGQAEIVVRDASVVEAIASNLKALAAARAASSSAQSRKDGSRSAAHDLARRTGTSVSAAQSAINTGERLSRQPEVSVAARSGALSLAQASLISDAVDADPSSGPHLLEVAKRGSLFELAAECGRIKAQAEPDPEAHRRAIHERRRLRTWSDTEGAWHISGQGPTDSGAQVDAAISSLREAIFNEARLEGRREHPDAYAFDALVCLAEDYCSAEPAPAGAGATPAGEPHPGQAETHPGAGESHPFRRRRPPRSRRGAQVKLFVRVDLDAYLRGAATDGETCEIAGYGPVPVSVVYDLMQKGDPLVVGVLTKAKEVVGIAHLGRYPTAHQKSALEWLYPTCAAEGCSDRMHLENDHREDWHRTHFTVFDLMDRLCRFHHRLKTNEGWNLIDGVGKRAFVAPADPRHPKNCHAA
jgi:hypothetical protein